MSYPRPAFRLASPSQPRTNRLAVASVIAALLWGFGIGSLLAIAFAVVARRQLRRRRQSGQTLATVGLVLGGLGLITTIVAGALVLFVDDDSVRGNPEAMADVKVASCAVDLQTGSLAAVVDVTNSSSSAANYVITIKVTNAAGDVVDRAYANAAQVAPGATTQVTAQSAIHEIDTPTCAVDVVSRYPSPTAAAPTSTPAETTPSTSAGG